MLWPSNLLKFSPQKASSLCSENGSSTELDIEGILENGKRTKDLEKWWICRVVTRNYIFMLKIKCKMR